MPIAKTGARPLHYTSQTAGIVSGIHLELIPDASWALGDYRLSPHPERVTQVPEPEYLRSRFERLAHVYSNYSMYRDLTVSAIAKEIVLFLAACWHRGNNPLVGPRLQDMIQYIREHLHEPLSRKDIANAFHLSQTHVSRLFKTELGLTLTDVINRERTMRAYRLMQEQDMSVKEAAFAVGYTDPFYFSRVFKRIFDVPPSQIS